MFRFKSKQEESKDEPGHAMRNFRNELKGSLFKQFLADIQKYHRALGKVRTDLQREIDLKEESSKLDRECLSLSPNSSSPKGDKASELPSKAIHHAYPEPGSPREREEHGEDDRGVNKSNFNTMGDKPLNTRKWKAQVDDTLHHAGPRAPFLAPFVAIFVAMEGMLGLISFRGL